MFREHRVAHVVMLGLVTSAFLLMSRALVLNAQEATQPVPPPSTATPPPATTQETPPAEAAPAPAPAPAPSSTVTLRAGEYVGASACASDVCHGSPSPRNLYKVKQNEYFIWKQDRHTQAYNVLLADKSARIMRNLKIKTKAQETKICLDCHAMNVPERAQATPLDIADGISCEACHGAAGGWLTQHTADGWTHQKSVAAGMRDLRGLENRARNCLACHLGDSQRTVSHELIAAGHPDMIFELDNYTAVMPPHWTPNTVKRRDSGDEEVTGARAWAVGQAVAFREGMLQIARHARANKWPEFADMNCYACHHALKDSAWRQKRGYRYKPGVPPWNPSRYAVLKHLVATFAPGENTRIASQVDRLAEQVAKLNTPPATVAATASNLATTIGRVIPRIENANVSNAVAKRIIDRIAGDVPYLVQSEVHSVEQAILAINALVNAMARNKSAMPSSGVTQAIDQLYADVKDRENFNRTEFGQHVAALQRQLR